MTWHFLSIKGFTVTTAPAESHDSATGAGWPAEFRSPDSAAAMLDSARDAAQHDDREGPCAASGQGSASDRGLPCIGELLQVGCPLLHVLCMDPNSSSLHGPNSRRVLPRQ